MEIQSHGIRIVIVSLSRNKYMSLKGKSFAIDTGNLDNVIQRIVAEEKRVDDMMFAKVTKITDMIWRIAHQKRAMITKQMAKEQGRTKRVSDPDATLGVPVDIGNLQASIKQEVHREGKSIIGTITAGGDGVNYAQAMEFGTSKVRARPFMRPAINETRGAVKTILAK